MLEFIMQNSAGICLILLGMAIGYILWFRDRKRDELIQTRLTESNSNLKRELKELSKRCEKAEEQLKLKENKVHILEELCDDLVTNRDHYNDVRIKLESELATRNEQLRAARDEVDNWRERSEVATQSMEHAQLEYIEKLNSLESEWRAKLGRAETDLSARETDVRHLASEQERIVAELHQSKSQIAELTAELETQRTMLATASHNANGLEKEYVTLESSLRSHTDLLKEARAQAAAADSARALAERTANDLRAQLERKQTEADELVAVRNEAEAAKRDFSVLSEKLNSSRERVNELADQCTHSEKECEQLRNSAFALNTRLGNQESTIRFQREQLDSLAKELAGERKLRIEQKEGNEVLISKLRSQLQTQNRKLESASIISEELKCQVAHFEKEKLQYVESTTITSAKMEALAEQRDELAKQLERLSKTKNQELTQIRARVEVMQRESIQHQSRITTLIRDRDELRSRLSELEESQAESEQLIEMQHQELQSRLHMTMAQRDQAFSESKENRERVEQLSELLERTRHESEANRLEVDSLREVLAELKSGSEDLRQQYEHSRQSFRETSSENETLRNELTARQQEIETQLEQLSNLTRENELLNGELASLQNEIDALLKRVHELNGIESENENLKIELNSLRKDFEKHLRTIDDLKVDDEPVSVPFVQDVEDPIYGGKTRICERRGRIYTEPPTIRDDLKRISGIAQVLERRLNEYGIYTYQQIMEWDAVAVQEFSTLLTFKDRIDRDDWIGQATSLYETTYLRAA